MKETTTQICNVCGQGYLDAYPASGCTHCSYCGTVNLFSDDGLTKSIPTFWSKNSHPKKWWQFWRRN